MRVRLLPLRFAQGRNDTWGIYFRNKDNVVYTLQVAFHSREALKELLSQQ